MGDNGHLYEDWEMQSDKDDKNEEQVQKGKLSILSWKKKQVSEKKKPKNKKRLPKMIAAVILVVAIVAGAVFTFRSQGKKAQTDVSRVMESKVQKGNLSQTVEGTGTLSNADSTDLKIPVGLKIKKIKVSEGDEVKKGDTLATVDKTSLLAALAQTQEDLDDINKQIGDEADSDTSKYVEASVDGRVKKIYASKNKNAADTVLEKGALMLISLDGKMAVKMDTTTSLTAGQEVKVTLSSGSSVTGTVTKADDESCTITVTDKGTKYNDKVTAYTSSGTKIGTGKLYINKEAKVTATSGTVSSILVSENEYVSEGDELIKLKGDFQSEEYLSLESEKEDLEEKLASLLKIAKNNTITADSAGIITAVNVSEDTESGSTSTSSTGSTSGSSSSSSSGSSSGSAGSGSSAVATGTSANRSMSTAKAISLQATSGHNTVATAKTATLTASSGTTAKTASLTASNTDATVKTVSLTASSTDATAKTVTLAEGDSTTEDTESSSETTTEKKNEASTSTTAAKSDTTQSDSKNSTSSSQSKSTESSTSSSGSTSTKNTTGSQKTSGSDNSNATNSNGSGNTTGNNTENSTGTSGAMNGTGKSGGMNGASGSNAGSTAGSFGSAAGNSASTGTSSDSSSSTSTSSETNTELTSAFSIASGNEMTLSVNVDEMDILSIKTGQKATVTFDAIEDKEYEGEITSIDKNGTTSNGTTKYPVEITLTKEDSMMSGMNASVTITTSEVSDVLLIPAAAVTEKGNSSYVYTQKDSKSGELSGETEVQTGDTDGSNIVITSGLSEGDTVYYSMNGGGSSDGNSDSTENQNKQNMKMNGNFGGGRDGNGSGGNPPSGGGPGGKN